MDLNDFKRSREISKYSADFQRFNDTVYNIHGILRISRNIPTDEKEMKQIFIQCV